MDTELLFRFVISFCPPLFVLLFLLHFTYWSLTNCSYDQNSTNPFIDGANKDSKFLFVSPNLSVQVGPDEMKLNAVNLCAFQLKFNSTETQCAAINNRKTKVPW